MTTTRTRLTREERHDQLVALGLAAIGASSFEEVSLDEIADEAGISRSLLFHYFPTKQDYFAAVARAAGEQLIAETDVDPDGPIEGRIRGGIDAFLSYVEDKGGAYASLVRGALGGDAQLQDIADEVRERLAQRTLTALLAELGVAPEDFDDGQREELRLTIRGWLGFVEETTVTWLREPGISRERLVDLLDASANAILQATAARLFA